MAGQKRELALSSGSAHNGALGQGNGALESGGGAGGGGRKARLSVELMQNYNRTRDSFVEELLSMYAPKPGTSNTSAVVVSSVIGTVRYRSQAPAARSMIWEIPPRYETYEMDVPTRYVDVRDCFHRVIGDVR